MFETLGRRDALIKLGFGPAEAQKVWQAVKPYKMTRAMSRTTFPGLGKVYEGPHAMRGPKAVQELKRPIQKLDEELAEAASKYEDIGYLSRSGAHPQFTWERMLNGGAPKGVPSSGVMSLGKGNVAKGLPRTPAEHRMENVMSAAHELDELKTSAGLAMEQFGHASPEVILREHNRVVTLPKAFKRVAERRREVRGRPGRESDFLREATGLEFGQGERLSRHARKRMTEMAEAHYRKQIVNEKLRRELMPELEQWQKHLVRSQRRGDAEGIARTSRVVQELERDIAALGKPNPSVIPR